MKSTPALENNKKSNDGNEGKESPRANLKQFASSYVLLAFALYLVLDTTLRFMPAEALKFSPLKVSHRSWVYWNMREFLQEPKSPDTAIFGSSLMMAALHGGDAVYLDQPQNVCFHHKSKLFKDLMAAQGIKEDNFAFALGGQMVSDAYVLFDNMVNNNRAPKRLIYGIAPRDFMDAALPSVASTEIYKYVSRMDDLSDIDMKARPSLGEKVEFAFNKASYIYGHREDFLYVQNRWAKELCKKLLGYKEMDLVKTIVHIRRQAFLELPEDSGPNEAMVCPPSMQAEPFTDNLNEYRFRYRKINWKQFNDQLSYLERLLALGQEKNVSIILVNMPLTTDNIALMPPGFYANYLEKVERMAASHKASVIDLNNPQLFPTTYFADSVHLNTRGGKHFFEVLAEKLQYN